MSESFGARLRQRREQQQISLSTIAEQTKIKLSLLEALERGDVSHWPSGIFRRAFIRAYALAIGLEPDVVVREFLELYPDPAEIVEPIPAIAATLDGPEGGGAPMRLRYLVASAVGSIARRRGRASAEPPPTVQPRPALDSSSPFPPGAARLAELHLPSDFAEPPEPAVVGRGFSPANAEAPEVMPEQPHSVPAREEIVLTPAPPVPASSVEEPQIPVSVPEAEGIDLAAVAELCTHVARVSSPTELPALLSEAARILDASGLVVWIWDPIAAELYPAMAHGYSERVLAQLPGLPRDANNATAAAFREAQTCVVPGHETGSGALVLPLLTAAGCAGVLALEMQKRNEERETVRATGAIIAAQLAALVGAAAAAEAEERVRSFG
jgi:transcriptional regulator with XRE-family HTH domain